MRRILDLNFGWRFTDSFDAGMTDPAYDDSSFELVDIPHTVKEIPYNYFDEKIYQFVSCYRRSFDLDDEALDGEHRVVLRFEGAANYARVYVNGVLCAEHKDGYTPFETDITSLVKTEGNVVAVELDSTERPEMPPFGRVVDYLVYGGIYREVSVKVLPKVGIDDIFVRTPDVGVSKKYSPVGSGLTLGVEQSRLLVADVTFSERVKGEMRLALRHDGAVVAERAAVVDGRTVRVNWRVDAKLWDIEDPQLYELVVGFGDDEDSRRFGFREAVFKRDGFYLNGRHVMLRGLNRHQSYPYVGNAMPASAQIADADTLKTKLGCNIVRTSHYPDSTHFIDRCDEIGLLVFTEMPSWQFLGEGEWRENCLNNIRAMIVRDRSHPSVILWGVRVNEGKDCDEFYSQTNALAHSLDDSRPTGGVRNMPRSHLLEDVYTYNDFSHDGGAVKILPPTLVTGFKAPYMVTEFAGHTYPVKSFDAERIRTEAGLRHARIQSAAAANKRVASATGWVMADYNTHKDFGSGDRICYHGVLDMFRIPKFSAALYSSQQDKYPVMEVSSTMDIGEYPGGIQGQVYIFTNCDYVKVYKNGDYKSTAYPDHKHYPGLKHPPVLPRDYIGDSLTRDEGINKKSAENMKVALVEAANKGFGMNPLYFARFGIGWLTSGLSVPDTVDLVTKYFANWGGTQTEYVFEGYKNGELVKRVVRTASNKVSLDVKADSEVLCEGRTYDVTRVELIARDEHGNRLVFDNAAISVKVDGPAKVIGPDVFSLIGGARAFWLRTTGGKGEITVTLTSPELDEKTIKLRAE